MDNIERLKQKLEEYLEENGRYPKVRISRDFWEKYANEIAELANMGVNIKVDDDILLQNTFLFNEVRKKGVSVNTVNDLKKLVDRLVGEGKGEWPVRNMPDDTNTYHRLRFYTIVPGEEPYEGIELFSSIANDIQGEHILVEIGE